MTKECNHKRDPTNLSETHLFTILERINENQNWVFYKCLRCGKTIKSKKIDYGDKGYWDLKDMADGY